MKYYISIFAQFLIGAIMAQKSDTLQLKNRFNTENAYVHFYFDYDSLRIDTIRRDSYQHELISYTGYKFEIDSFLSSGIWIEFEELEQRFFIQTFDNELFYAHEEYRDKFGRHFTKYEYDSNTGMKIYETFTEEGVGIQILEKNDETRISLDSQKVCLIKRGNQKRKKGG